MGLVFFVGFPFVLSVVVSFCLGRCGFVLWALWFRFVGVVVSFCGRCGFVFWALWFRLVLVVGFSLRLRFVLGVVGVWVFQAGAV